MDTQTKAAIIAIAIVIPLSALAVWNLDKSVISYASTNTNQKIIVITSFYPLFEFTKKVGGDRAEVTQLIPFGIEPHDWEPTVKDLQKMQQADLIVINGIGFENWANDFASINTDVIIVDTSKGITTNENNLVNHPTDPHIWLNPVMAKKQVQNIADALMEIDPANKEYYNTNANSYILRLEGLDEKIKQELSQCTKNDFISFHSAFTYFADQYGLVQHSILESNEPHDEPTSQNLENMINLATSLDIDVIFTEEAVDTRTSEVIADEIGGTVLVLSPLEIGDKNTDYIEKMEQNLLHLKEGLCN
ncbi:MAG: metal ABC transporter substrate-binding protein [Nitrososphaerota archaeon]